VNSRSELGLGFYGVTVFFVCGSLCLQALVHFIQGISSLRSWVCVRGAHKGVGVCCKSE